MFLSKSLTILVLVIAISTSVKGQVVGLNDHLPLMYNNFNNVSTANATGLGISSRNVSAMVLNPATAAKDDFTSFNVNVAGLVNTIRYSDVEIRNSNFGINSINALVHAGSAGNFFLSFSNNFHSDFNSNDDNLGTSFDVRGGVSKATAGWALGFRGINAGFSVSKNMGSYRLMQVLSDPNWDPLIIRDNAVDFSANLIDQYSVGLVLDVSENIAIGVNYQSRETIVLIENIETSAIASDNRVWQVDTRESTREIGLNSMILAGVTYKINDYTVAVDGGGDFMEDDNSFITASLGVTYNGLRDNTMPIYSTLRYNSFNRFGVEYFEVIGKIGLSHLLNRDGGRLDFSAGPVYRKSADGFREIAAYTGVSITGFGRWGN